MDAVHFDGPVVAGGTGYRVDEVLGARPPVRWASGSAPLDALTGGVGPGAVWTVRGPAGLGVTALAASVALGVARQTRVLVVNGHVPTRVLAERLGGDGDVPDCLRVASWMGLPRLAADSLTSEMGEAGLVVLDTVDESWADEMWSLGDADRVRWARNLRDRARQAQTALLLTARLAPGAGSGGPVAHWTDAVFPDVADVRIELSDDPVGSAARCVVRSRLGRGDRLRWHVVGGRGHLSSAG